MKNKWRYLCTTAFIASLLTGCTNQTTADEKIHIEFFQNKPEAVATFDHLIERFEKLHPNIDIEQNNVPDSETVLRTRLVKEDVPDLLAIGGNATYGDIAEEGLFYDFSKDSAINKVIPDYVNMLNLLGRTNNEVNGIPFATNANMLLYNKDKFKELGLQVPKTWDELINVSKRIQKQGELPFYFTYKDAWTAMVSFNALAGNLQGDNFIQDRNSNKTTFTEHYKETLVKMLTLLDYGHKDNFGRDYNAGNRAFANGESVMYIQGSWAISSIKAINPNIKLGSFPLPASNDSSQNKLVSGVDTALTMSKDTPHKKEALMFIHFLLEKENSQYYIKEQNSFSAVKNVLQNDEALKELNPYFVQQKITSFPEHYFPASMQAANLIQDFLIKGEVKPFLSKLDDEWNKVKARE
ncbi:ABC transporter substrate-binding protein [Peribacillus simplex]|uniref:ABC transporter substrate-binding protein n=1 Tax=Peribacillus simplex TaxID=1478 RepID=UPI003D2668EF